jgi:hypothetical protein
MDLVVLMTTRLEATNATFVAFLNMPKKGIGMSNPFLEDIKDVSSTSEIHYFNAQVEGCLASSRLLEKRIKGLIKSVSVPTEIRKIHLHNRIAVNRERIIDVNGSGNEKSTDFDTSKRSPAGISSRFSWR